MYTKTVMESGCTVLTEQMKNISNQIMAISEKQFPWSLFTLSWSAMNTVFKLVLHEKRSKQTWLLFKNPTFLSRPDFQNELILMLNKDIADIAVQFTQHSKNDLTKGNVFLFYSAILLLTTEHFSVSFSEDLMWLIPILWCPYGAPGLHR